jgi:Na+/proline symporter
VHPLDWAFVVAYAALSAAFAIGFAHRRRRAGAGQAGEDFMVAGRRLPWWIVGIADVATVGGADAFWVYVFFVGGFMAYHRFFWISAAVSMPLGVVWARYWRRLALASPGQIYEERYGGRAAARFRAFSSLWGALVSTSIVLGYVLQGLAQSMAPFLHWPVDVVLLFFCGTTLAYTLVSGLLAVAYGDLAQFALMMLGRIVLAAILIGSLGGLSAVIDRVEAVRGAGFLQPYPPSTSAAYGEFAVDPLSLIALLLGGALGIAGTQSTDVQKSLAARDERHAALGQIFNSVLSLGVRVLPIALVGLCAIAVFPPGRRDTDLWADLVRAHARPGLVGLLLVGIVAGYMSTIDGLVNFSAAALLNDLYRRYLRPSAGDARQVRFGRAATLLVTASAYLWARVLIRQIDGAWINFINSVIWLFMVPLGVLRWIWWRLNIWGEVVGFVLSFPAAYLVWFGGLGIPAFKDKPYWQSFGLLTGAGWAIILLVTLCTKAERKEVLERFYRRARPPGFWGPIAALTDGSAGAARARRLAAWQDLGIAISGLAFTASLTVGLGAALARQWVLATGLTVTGSAAAMMFVRWSTKGEHKMSDVRSEAPRAFARDAREGEPATRLGQGGAKERQ